MIVHRSWTNDLYAFYCAEAMDRQGIRVVAVTVSPSGMWGVWGQAEQIDFKALDAAIDCQIDGETRT